MSAHRGAPALAPENTLASYEYAFAYGVDLVEVDVQQTADGRFVALHDSTVDRTTDGTGAVDQLTFAQLRALNAADYAPWAGGPYDPSQMASIEEVMTLARQVGAGIEFDIKGSVTDEDRLADLAAEHGVLDTSIFNSSDPRIVAAQPEARLIYNTSDLETPALLWHLAQHYAVFGSRLDEYTAEEIVAIHDGCGIVMPTPTTPAPTRKPRSSRPPGQSAPTGPRPTSRTWSSRRWESRSAPHSVARTACAAAVAAWSTPTTLWACPARPSTCTPADGRRAPSPVVAAASPTGTPVAAAPVASPGGATAPHSRPAASCAPDRRGPRNAARWPRGPGPSRRPPFWVSRRRGPAVRGGVATRAADALPFGRLDPQADRTLGRRLRCWVRDLTGVDMATSSSCAEEPRPRIHRSNVSTART